MQQYKTDTKIATDFTKKQRASHQRNSTKETTMKEKGRGGGGGADVGILSGECLTLTAPRSSPCLLGVIRVGVLWRETAEGWGRAGG